MKYIVLGKNIEITEALEDVAISKVGKLEKFFNDNVEAHITLSVQKNKQIVEVTIPFNGIFIRAEERQEDMYASIDKVVDKLERQVVKNKSKLIKKHHVQSLKSAYMAEAYSDHEEVDYTVFKSKKFAFKPMIVEEAILQMNLLGHEFFMFSNSETNKVNVVYKRKDGNFGLIEQEF